MHSSFGFLLDTEKGYFKNHGVDVMAFDDIYPAGHQSGVSILMHGRRVATNGDIRFEQTPGQWQPLPKQGERKMDKHSNTITTSLRYPDMDAHLRGFNPMIYPDYAFSYTVTVRGEGEKVIVTVDLDKPVPDIYLGKMCFNLELFPADLFGKPYIMDGKGGIFPRQPNGPTIRLNPNYVHGRTLQPLDGITTDIDHITGRAKEYSPIIADDIIALPYAEGKVFTVRPDEPGYRFTVESKSAPIKLYDGRMNHNNGWFVLSAEIEEGKTEKAVEWVITPNVIEGWKYAPVVQTSQVGYMPCQKKVALIELDGREEHFEKVRLYKITQFGEALIKEAAPSRWGEFLRYQYLSFDFSDIEEEGLYKVAYALSESSVFEISKGVYDRGVWQPVLEYFLPVQMCHMRVNEKYRVWHGLCHNDDAVMAPVSFNHIDGYVQGPETLTKYKSGDPVPGLNQGGWHDAGDYDLRVESQAGEMYILSLAYEAFSVSYDQTTIDQNRKLVEIHQPDGKNDILQQIEHGALSVVGAYRALGRLYRGIIARSLRQYVLLGDTANATNNVLGDEDDRWVFTEDNPPRELTTAAELAASCRALRDLNPDMAGRCLSAAKELYEITRVESDYAKNAKLHAAVELFISTGDQKYKSFILSETGFIEKNLLRIGWIIARAVEYMKDDEFTARIRKAILPYADEIQKMSLETPYGIPYRPHIWGAGWSIQKMGFEMYFLNRAFPDLFSKELIFSALNFVLGCHPGSNTASFASGVGAVSATTAYGLNRADFSYIPGGVISGTALIRPDFPELLTWPYLWQQTEYVLGGGSSHYMFLVLAAKQLLNK